MKQYVDLVLKSMAEKDPGLLPLADRYRATENSIPGALNMLTAWRLVSRVNALGPVVADEELGNIVMTANLEIGGAPATFWARIAVADDRITELELFHAKSRGEGGYVMLAEEIGNEPAVWKSAIPESGRATREELLALGRAIFIDTAAPTPPEGDDCVVMEQGGVVHEFAEFHDLLMGVDTGPHAPEDTVVMPYGLAPFRPSDPKARVVAADVEQGLVVTIGMVPGYILPTVTSAANISAFVPASMREMHARSVLPKWLEGRSVIDEIEVMCVSMHVLRMFDGKLQASEMFNSLTGAGARSVWVD